MKNECFIVRDLLPLYAEGMTSPETAEFVSAHLAECEACRSELAQTKDSEAPQRDESSAAPLMRIRKTLRRKRIRTAALAVVMALAIFASAFAVLDAPEYLPYSEGLVSVRPTGEGELLLEFGDGVTDFDYSIYPDPDGGERRYCEVEAWTSLWDKWFSGDTGRKSAVIDTAPQHPVTVYYTPNNGGESVTVYGDDGGDGGMIVLPRYALAVYPVLAAAAELVLCLLWLLLKRCDGARRLLRRLIPYPVLYIVAQLIVSGFSESTYSMTRDFLLAVFISLLLYCAVLLVQDLRQMKKEAQALDMPKTE